MRNVLQMKYPAGWFSETWREATPIGNGEIGGLVYGGVHHEIIAFNHSKLWWRYKLPVIPEVSYLLPKVRSLLLENKVAEAGKTMFDELVSKGVTKTNTETGSPLPVCDIDIVTHYKKPFKNYLRSLDMEKGVSTVIWNEDSTLFKREFFISRENNTSYLKITADGDFACEASISLKIHELETSRDSVLPENPLTEVDGNYISFSAKNIDGKDFGGVMKIKHNGTLVTEKESVRVNAKEILCAVKLFVNSNKDTDIPALKKELEADFSFDEELKKHVKLHSEIFNSTEFKLSKKEYNTSNEELLLEAYQGESSEELVEKLWSFSRYLLVSSSKKDGLPCHLYGLWNGDWNPKWPWNMFNVNLEMTYWQALSGNMPKLLLAVFDYVEKNIPDYRENAKKLFGCRGINICSVSTPVTGLYTVIHPHILHWIGGAGWICQHYFDYWRCTRDVEFLKNRAMPFMYETALFYEDYLIEDENGYLMVIPSNSPENTPANVFEEGSHSKVVINATMDFAILKELLTNIIKGAKITGMYQEKIALWEEMLSKIPPYKINKDGAIAEWMHDFYEDNYEHRHQSHLYPVFPGTEITKNNNPSLFDAFKIALQKREVVGLKNQSGWSLAYMANIYARLGKGDNSLNVLSMLAQSNIINNFFTVHNDWRKMGIATCGEGAPPVQLDAICAYNAAINEMFVFSTEDELHLFNALPSRFKCGKIGPLLSRTNTEVTLEWNESSAKAMLKQLNSDVTFNLILPENMAFADASSSKLLTLHAGESVEFEITFI